jgi:hypothetical protein
MATSSGTTTTLNPPRLRRTDPRRQTYLVRLDLAHGVPMRRCRGLDQVLNRGRHHHEQVGLWLHRPVHHSQLLGTPRVRQRLILADAVKRLQSSYGKSGQVLGR